MNSLKGGGEKVHPRNPNSRVKSKERNEVQNNEKQTRVSLLNANKTGIDAGGRKEKCLV